MSMGHIKQVINDAGDGFDADKNRWTFNANLLVTVGGVAFATWLVVSFALHWLMRWPFWLFGVPLAPTCAWAGWQFILRRAESGIENRAPKHLRGSKLIEPAELQKQLDDVEEANLATWSDHTAQAKGITVAEARRIVEASRQRRVSLEFGGVTLPPDIETQGILFVGGTGSGKSVALKRSIAAKIAAGHKMMILDPKPELIREFWQPDSVLLNPFDKNGAKWDFWSEIKELPDIRAVAEGVFPPTPDDDFAENGARAIFAGLLELATSNEGLFRLLSMDTADLEQQLATTLSAGSVNSANSRGTGTFLQRLNQALNVYRYPDFRHPAGTPKFSITDWILNEDDKRLVFLSFNEGQLGELRPLLTLWIDIAIRRLLTMPEARDAERSKQRRVGFVLEELPSLKAPIPMLEPLVTRGRSFGAMWDLVLQDPSQLEEIFGEGTTRSLLSNTTTWLIFRTNDHETATMMAEKIGEREELRKQAAITMGVEESKDGKSIGDSQDVTQTVLASEIMMLPDNWSLLSIGGPYYKSKIFNLPLGLPKVSPGLDPRDDLVIVRRMTPSATEGAVAYDVKTVPPSAERAGFTGPDADGVIEVVDNDHLSQALDDHYAEEDATLNDLLKELKG